MATLKTIDPYRHRSPATQQEPDTQSGDYFVSVLDRISNDGNRDRYALASGPYSTHQAAIADIETVREISEQHDPRTQFLAFGTCRLDPKSGRIGVLQKHKLHAIQE